MEAMVGDHEGYRGQREERHPRERAGPAVEEGGWFADQGKDARRETRDARRMAM